MQHTRAKPRASCSCLCPPLLVRAEKLMVMVYFEVMCQAGPTAVNSFLLTLQERPRTQQL